MRFSEERATQRPKLLWCSLCVVPKRDVTLLCCLFYDDVLCVNCKLCCPSIHFLLLCYF